MSDNLQLKEQEDFKEVPYNEEAEQAVLGAILINNENINKIADFLLAKHFYIELNQKTYIAITTLLERGLVANPITLKTFFEGNETLSASGINAYEYLVKLAAKAENIINIISFAKVTYELYLKRSLIGIGSSLVNDVFEEKQEAAEKQIEKAEHNLYSLASEGNLDKGATTLSQNIKSALQRIEIAKKRGEKINGVTTGYTDLDKMLGGMQNSDLIILAARPSMGKTSLAVNIALNAAENFTKNKEEKSIGVFSLEMSGEQIATRLLSIKSGVNGSKIRVGNISDDEFLKLSASSGELNELPIYVDDTPALSISALRTRARRMKRKHNISVIVIDYIQLMRGSSSTEGNRVNEIGEITMGLKAIAKELDLPVIGLSQLSRAVESRDDKRPQLSDLRESGNIEQDADVVMFIYREEYYLMRKEPKSDPDKHVAWQAKLAEVENISEVIISKQRNGPVGTISLRFDSSTTGFTDLDVMH